MKVSAGGNVTAKPWSPEWLEEKNAPVDEASMGESLRPSISNPPNSDPWVKNKFSGDVEALIIGQEKEVQKLWKR